MSVFYFLISLFNFKSKCLFCITIFYFVSQISLAAGFLSLSEWYFTICPTPYNRK